MFVLQVLDAASMCMLVCSSCFAQLHSVSQCGRCQLVEFVVLNCMCCVSCQTRWALTQVRTDSHIVVVKQRIIIWLMTCEFVELLLVYRWVTKLVLALFVSHGAVV